MHVGSNNASDQQPKENAMKQSVRKAVAGIAITVISITGAGIASSAPASAAPTKAPAGVARPAGNWAWYGYKLNRAETNQIANLSLWSPVSGVQGSNLIPYSKQAMQIFAFTWILTARNARSRSTN